MLKTVCTYVITVNCITSRQLLHVQNEIQSKKKKENQKSYRYLSLLVTRDSPKRVKKIMSIYNL